MEKLVGYWIYLLPVQTNYRGNNLELLGNNYTTKRIFTISRQFHPLLLGTLTAECDTIKVVATSAVMKIWGLRVCG